jgi:hypothetical protein
MSKENNLNVLEKFSNNLSEGLINYYDNYDILINNNEPMSCLYKQLYLHPNITNNSTFRFKLDRRGHLFLGIEHNYNIININYIFNNNLIIKGIINNGMWSPFNVPIPICMIDNLNIVVEILYNSSIDQTINGYYGYLSEKYTNELFKKLIYLLDKDKQIYIISGIIGKLDLI